MPARGETTDIGICNCGTGIGRPGVGCCAVMETWESGTAASAHGTAHGLHMSRAPPPEMARCGLPFGCSESRVLGRGKTRPLPRCQGGKQMADSGETLDGDGDGGEWRT